MTESTRCIFSGMRMLVGQHWVTDQALIVEEGKIKAIIPEAMIKHHLPAKRHEFFSDDYLVPGFIDLHMHGAKGHDVMDASDDAMKAISHALAQEGVTGYLATTMTASSDKIEAVLKMMPAAMRSQEGAEILGVHLEGPFIAKAKMGAQFGDGMMPDSALMRHWQGISHGAIKLVTLAPELPGALDLIESLHKMDVIASIGHTNATYEETCQGIAAGCSQATHLFNAMSGLGQREPGAAAALLLSNDVTAELIVDGVHLHPAMTELALRVKKKERLLLVTDAMRAKCCSDGQYDLGGQMVDVKGGKATLVDGTLAGSTLRMPQAIKNMATFSKCSLEDAIYMATFNPARVLNLPHKGSIGVGMDADLVVLNADFEVKLTMRAGKDIFK
jgi:N-acetylglucosamine-6-phosphate deacetylase